jgi:WD40 repeat protein
VLRVSVAVGLILAVVASVVLSVARSPVVIAGEMSTVFYPAAVTLGGKSVSSISYSSDGTLLAAAVDDGSVRVFSVPALRPAGGLPKGTRALLSPVAATTSRPRPQTARYGSGTPTRDRRSGRR